MSRVYLLQGVNIDDKHHRVIADLDRDIEYAFETEEPMSARPPAGDIE